jgi:hypothetical protein
MRCDAMRCVRGWWCMYISLSVCECQCERERRQFCGTVLWGRVSKAIDSCLQWIIREATKKQRDNGTRRHHPSPAGRRGMTRQ